MNIANKLIFASLLISCTTESETHIKQETKSDICSELKEIYCQKLFECDGVSLSYCNSIASLDTRCEQSSATITQLDTCRTLLYNTSCTEGVPQYCKDLEDQ